MANQSLGFHEPQLKPVSPDPVDDEFEGEALNEAWAWDTAPDAYQVGARKSWLEVQLDGAKTRKLIKTFAPEGAFGLEVMLSGALHEEGDRVGIALLDADEAHIADCYHAFSDNGQRFDSSYPIAPVFAQISPNLLVNPGFEGAFTPWEQATMQITTLTPKAGSYCVRGSTGSAPTTTQYARYVRQGVAIGEDDLGAYVFSCWLRRHTADGNGGSSGRARARVRDPDDVTVYETPIVSTTAWQNFVASIDVNKVGTWVVWMTSFSASGGAGWDAVGYGDEIYFGPRDVPAAPSSHRTWIRIARDGSNVYRYWVSTDGTTWLLVYISDALATAVAKVALVFEGAGAGVREFGVNYLRAFPYALPRKEV